jgi:sporulation integral membrane protein YlbJ
MKNKFIEILLFLSIILLIIAPKTAFAATSAGLILWFNTIIPSLLPFLIVSSLVVKLNLLKHFDRFLEPIVYKLFKLPPCAIYPIFFGIVSGYPTGAKVTADLYADKYITKKEAEYLLSFCNNCNPMFLIGFVCISQLKMSKGICIIPLIVYLSSFMSALFLRPFLLDKNSETHNTTKYTPKKFRFSLELFDECIFNSCAILLKVGVYIIIFSIIAGFISLIPIHFEIGKALLIGFVELTNGISYLSTLTITETTKIVLSCTLIAFGGLSISAQTSSVIANKGLSSIKYILCKLINALIAFLLSLLLFYFI